MCLYLLSATTLEGRMKNGPPLGIFSLNQLEANKRKTQHDKHTQNLQATSSSLLSYFHDGDTCSCSLIQKRGSHFCFCWGGYMLYYHMAVIIYAATISAEKSDGNADGKIMYDSVHKRKNLSQHHSDIQRDCSDSMRLETPR